jgi:hypothetical protein
MGYSFLSLDPHQFIFGATSRTLEGHCLGHRHSRSVCRITRTITDGVPKPKNYSVRMPPRGGAPLSDSDVAAVAAYVWAISHPGGK